MSRSQWNGSYNMNSFVTGVGWFVIAMLALALAGFAICCVLWLYEKAMEPVLKDYPDLVDYMNACEKAVRTLETK